jgi:predicted phosphodiesterase
VSAEAAPALFVRQAVQRELVQHHEHGRVREDQEQYRQEQPREHRRDVAQPGHLHQRHPPAR